jgi:hypothetical protein
MCSARRSVQAVALFFVSTLCSLPAFSQTVQFLSLESGSRHLTTDSRLSDRLSLSTSTRPCPGSSNPSLAFVSGNASRIDDSLTPCDSAPVVPSIVPCNPSVGATAGCAARNDAVGDDLNAMGKQGHSILEAREKVLEILQTKNACSEWYQTKESDPAAVFRTLTFAVDRGSDVYVRVTAVSDGIELIRSPYVARVLQGEGLKATVTINTNGAFFLPTANVVKDTWEGGPWTFRGSRALQVGPYSGGTFRAQVLALLHEFGHVIDLLPVDQDDHEGKSRQNTMEVLRACRAEVESKEKPHMLWASH